MTKAVAVLAFTFLIACTNEQARTDAARPPSAATSSAITTTHPLPSSESIAILEPANGAVVPHRPIVRGTVRTGSSKPAVWVIVHPMMGSEYWVQPRPDVDIDGMWSAQIYIGRDEGSHQGEHFKIMAVANPRIELQEQDRLREWPAAEWQSRIVEVVKQ